MSLFALSKLEGCVLPLGVMQLHSLLSPHLLVLYPAPCVYTPASHRIHCAHTHARAHRYTRTQPQVHTHTTAGTHTHNRSSPRSQVVLLDLDAGLRHHFAKQAPQAHSQPFLAVPSEAPTPTPYPHHRDPSEPGSPD